MEINSVTVTTRHNRPSVLSKTALIAYFLNNGQYADPHEVSSVSIFAANNNFYPSSVVTPDGEIDANYSSLVLANFANTSGVDPARTSTSSFDVSNYNVGASGIYRLSEGVYAVVLDPLMLSSVFNLSGIDAVIENRVSSTGDYIDVWTVRRTINSDLDAIINEFTLSEDRFLTVTEPLLINVTTKLANNQIVLGSKVDLKFTNEVTLENTNLDRSIINLFKQALVIDPQLEVYKLNNGDRNLPSRVKVLSFEDTSAVCQLTSNNTVVYTLDTSILSTHPELTAGNLGSLTGTYVARLKFTALNQLFLTNDMAFTIR